MLKFFDVYDRRYVYGKLYSELDVKVEVNPIPDRILRTFDYNSALELAREAPEHRFIREYEVYDYETRDIEVTVWDFDRDYDPQGSR